MRHQIGKFLNSLQRDSILLLKSVNPDLYGDRLEFARNLWVGRITEEFVADSESAPPLGSEKVKVFCRACADVGVRNWRTKLTSSLTRLKWTTVLKRFVL
jgi:hypothetical protein